MYNNLYNKETNRCQNFKEIKLTEIEEMEYVGLFWHIKIKTIQQPNQIKTINY